MALPRTVKASTYRWAMKCSRATVSAVAAMTMVVAATAGCSSGPERSPAPYEVPEPSIEQPRSLPTADTLGVDRGDPVAVMVAMCTIVFTRDAATENSYSASYLRARDLMADPLAADLTKAGQVSRPYPKWASWVSEKAWVDGECEPNEITSADGSNPNTDRKTIQVLTVTETIQPAGNAEERTEQEWTVFTTAEKTGDGNWQVTQFDLDAT